MYGNSEEKCQVDVSKIIQFDCDGLTFCILSASIGAYGDPGCKENVIRRLAVRYWCGTKGKGSFTCTKYSNNVLKSLEVKNHSLFLKNHYTKYNNR